MYRFMGETKLVGGFNPSEKYESLGTWDDYSQHMESHNPLMFQTTSQIGLIGDDITIVRWDYKLKYANL
jgi:hypothetical protein